MTAPAPPQRAPEEPAFSEILVGLCKGEDERLSVREIMDALGEQGLGAIMLLFALINLMPLPPGVTTITGFPLLVLSVELIFARQTIWLPRGMMASSIPRSTFRNGVGWLVPVIRLAEKLTRPRMTWLSGSFGQGLIGLTCFLLSIVLVLPIPLGNMVPAATMAFFALGMMQRDGIAVILGWASTALSIGLLAVAWRVVTHAVENFVDAITVLPIPIP